MERPTLKEILTNPASLVSYLIAVVGAATNPAIIDALISTIWVDVSTLFTAASVSAFTLAPNLGWSTTLLEPAALLLGALLILKLLLKVFDSFEERV